MSKAVEADETCQRAKTDTDPPAGARSQAGQVKGWQAFNGALQNLAKSAGDAKTTLGALTLLVYGSVRFGYEGFYSRFNLRPEDVGIDQLAIITRAALGIIWLVLLGVGFAALTVVVARLAHLVRKRSKGKTASEEASGPSPASAAPAGAGPTPPPNPPGSPGGAREAGHEFVSIRWLSVLTAMALLMAGVLVAIVVVPSLWNPQPIRYQLVVDICWVITGACSVGLYVVWNRWPTVSGLSSHADDRRNLTIFLAALGAIAVLVASEQYGEKLAFEVSSVEKAGTVDTGPLPLTAIFGVRVDAVCVAWIGTDQPPNLDLKSSFFLLGQMQGITIVYQRPTFMKGVSNEPGHDVLRLPSAKVTVRHVELTNDNPNQECSPRPK